MEDNLDFYEYCYQDIRQIFNKFTACFAVGARSAFRHAVFVEYSLGLGYAYSIYDKNKEAYDRTVFGFGYNGIYPAVNIKVGFNIK
jgi:hypothetical protein